MIVCEIGLNHMGNIEYAKEYVNKIIELKPDGITFYVGDELFYSNPKFSNFILPDSFYEEIIPKLHHHKIKFGVMISDPNKINFFNNLETDFYKVFSNDILNFKLISKMKLTKKPIFVSTGMSDLDEIKKLASFISDSRKQFTLIHTQLSNKINLVNLKAIYLLKRMFQLPIAFGNHSDNFYVMYVSLAFEPSDIFFYVKGDRDFKHPDESHALSFSILPTVLDNLRNLPNCLGKEIKIKATNEIAEEYI
jgi:sialic acid synthase SpsE